MSIKDFLTERSATVGLDMSDNLIHVAVLDRSASITISSPDKITQSLKQLWSKNKIRSKKVNVAIHVPDLLVHILTIPMVKDEEIQSILENKINTYVMFAGVTTVIGWEKILEISEVGERKLKVLLTVAKRALLDPYIAAIMQAGLQIESITVPCLAVMHALKQTSLKSGPRENKILVDLDSFGQTSILLLKGGTVTFTHQGTIECLTDDLKKLLQREEKISDIVLHSQTHVPDDVVTKLTTELKKPITTELNMTASGLAQFKAPAINLLSSEVKSEEQWRTYISHFLFSVLWLSLFMLFLFFFLYAGNSIMAKKITRVNTELNTPNKQAAQAKEVEDTITETRRLLAGRQRVMQKNQNFPWDDVFTELTEILPSNVSLTHVEVNAEESMLLSGMARSSDYIFDFFNKLKNANYFKNADLKVVKKEDETGERVLFSIYAERK